MWKQNLAKELLGARRVNFPRRKVYARAPDEIWTSDLMDMQRYARTNKGLRYVLIVLDVFSRFAYVRGLKDKTGKTVATSLDEIMKTSKRQPRYLWTDQGTEYYNRDVKNVLRRRNIELYSTHNTVKASIAERVIRTFRRKIEREYIVTESTVWYDKLDAIVHEYNTTRHRTIKMTPLEALEPENLAAVYATQFTGSSGTAPIYYIGQQVRTSLNKKLFEKESTQAWSEEVFRVSDVVPSRPTTYRLEDLMGENLEGSFYAEQLKATKQKIFRIEKVIRKRDGRALVRWAGYDSKFDSWISETDIHHA